MIDSCAVIIAGTPFDKCAQMVQAAGGVLPADAGGVAIGECVTACDAHGEGPVAACIAKNANECSATSPDGNDSVFTECASSVQQYDPTCLATCESADATCLAACPTSSFDACVSCGETCDNTYASCEQKCPKAS